MSGYINSLKSQQPLAEAVKPYLHRGEIAGLVTLVADKEQVLHFDAAGFADIESGNMMCHNTLFWIASQTKPITAVALMMLVDEGKVNVEAPVADYLPEFAEQWMIQQQDESQRMLVRPTPAMLVRHLLTHTAGLPFCSQIEWPTLDRLPLELATRSYAMSPLEWAPGSRYSYSNAGINSIGRIIEVVSGIDYASFLDQRIFTPLGMADTTFWPTKEQLTRLASAYRPGSNGELLQKIIIDQLRYPLADISRQPMPAGGLFSTAFDCALFCRMMLLGGTVDGKEYLSAYSHHQMTSLQTKENWTDRYGFGWAVGDGLYGHGGAFATNMEVNSRTGLLTIFLLQSAGFPGEGGNCLPDFKVAVRKNLN